jgi:hypothetical protein
VAYLTLSADEALDGAQRAAIDAVIARSGGTSSWRMAAGRSYALLDVPDAYDAGDLRALFRGTVYDRPVIALALFPAVEEALPMLREALMGAGRPAGILASYACDRGVVVEWDPAITEARLVLALADVELQRFGSGRVAELLSPLPPATAAAIAASGLQAPQVEPHHILELGIERG